MRREPAFANAYLKRVERQREYQKHLNWIRNVSTQKGLTDTSPPPPIRRLERNKRVVSNERVLQFRYDQMNLRSIKLIAARQRQNRAYTAHGGSADARKWTKTLDDREFATNNSRAPSRNRKRTSEAAQNTRVISYHGMTVVENRPSEASL